MAEGPAEVVILDRIEPKITPPYCIHGRTQCIACHEWCWLGSETLKLVLEGEALPLCMVCALKYAKPEMCIGHTTDHRRADGPHV